MAKPYLEITKTEFKENYNVVKVLTDKLLIMKQLQTFNSKNQAVAFGIKKEPRDTMPKWFKEWSEKAYEVNIQSISARLTKIETSQQNDHNLLLKVIKLNNLKTK